MKSNYSRILKSVFLCSILIITHQIHAYALKISSPKEIEFLNKDKPNMERLVYFKMPLKQADYHWYFYNKNDLLAGSLVLKIKRENSENIIVVFQNGEFTEGWSSIKGDSSCCNNDELSKDGVYFGFVSSNKYMTSPNDSIEIVFKVIKDLPGIGACKQGILKRGIYRSKGNFLVFDKRENDEDESTAYIDYYDVQWDLNITKNEGWSTGKVSPENFGCP